MNKFLAMTVLTSFLMGPQLSFAQDKSDEHAAHHPDAQAADKKPGAAAPGMPMHHMHDNMKKMQDLMGKIQASKDPKEVELLLEEHMKLMREQMKGMHGMMGEGMMGKGMMGGKQSAGGGPKDGGMMGDEMMQHRQMMMEHMRMMHGMMEQMMEHMSVEHHMTRPDAAKKKP